jgi:hypothetical protein
MRRLILIIFPLTLLALSGCTQPDTYPVTGEECGPDDPVRSLDAGDCVTPIG